VSDIIVAVRLGLWTHRYLYVCIYRTRTTFKSILY